MNTPPLRLTHRQTDAHKGNFGRVLLIGGSRGMSGSIALSSIAALKTGSGLVTAMVPSVCLETVASFHPGVMTIPASDEDGHFAVAASAEVIDAVQDVSALGCGPGITTQKGSVAIVEHLVSMSHVPRVFDADALNILSRSNLTKRLTGDIVLTPHPGELERITGVSRKSRASQIAASQKLAQQTGAIIVVKGGPSVVVSPQDKWVNTTGNPGMATAGSGDVLTGIITSLLGQGLSTWNAARLGVWIHGLAGDLAARKHSQPGLTCVELLESVGAATAKAIADGGAEPSSPTALE
ncbi:ATP-dependent (S)-NAD(P)H-hydrate dehydratase [Planctomycetes bacterium K23_9]|uniref:ADP-dependent (S)-NAD(P)H-hydrate dehydratase n=2 Tax=Stieleria marina TaxID=1930275 RepID=A0A517NP42_9BACT|nr:ATP-dependent (S)-NAD(P)H-hydrate dehydratase [Planctomycetes bacterium K23_9]